MEAVLETSVSASTVTVSPSPAAEIAPSSVLYPYFIPSELSMEAALPSSHATV